MIRALALLAASAALLAACGPKEPAAPPAKAGPRAYRVAVQPVGARPLAYAVESVGTVEAYSVVSVPSRVAGVIEALSFDEGDRVTTDQVLAVVDGRRTSLDLERARAAVGRAEAFVGSARARTGQAEAALLEADAALKEAETGYARRKGLREKSAGWVSEDELSTLESAVTRARATSEKARASVEEARAGERVAAAQVEEERAALAITAKDAEDSRVRSPLAGVIERRHVAPGQYVKAGDAVATLVDASRLRVRFRVSEAESVLLRNGQAVEVRVAAFPNEVIAAEVFHVNATADPVTRMVECVAAVKDARAGLRPGFFASVRAEISRAEAAVVVPSSAILPSERGFTAFVVESGKARVRAVRLGLHTREGGVEVISGLAAGESLVVEGASTLQDGVPVTIDAPAPSAPPGTPVAPGTPGTPGTKE